MDFPKYIPNAMSMALIRNSNERFSVERMNKNNDKIQKKKTRNGKASRR